MKEETKKLLSILLVVIIVASAMAAAVTFGINHIKEEEKDEEKPLSVMILAEPSSGTAPHTVNFKPVRETKHGNQENIRNDGTDGE